MRVIHYLYDPLCAFSRVVSPLVLASQKVDGLELKLHGIGLYPYPTPYPSATAGPIDNFVAEAKKRYAQIEKETGLRFSPNLEATLRGFPLDSSPSIAAVLSADQLGGRGVEMLNALLDAFFSDGQSITDKTHLTRHAERIGLKKAAFESQYDATVGKQTIAHIKSSRELLTKAGADGCPSFILEHDGKLTAVKYDHRNPKEWVSGLLRN
jgi:putative protein-disulfide isomerase